MIAHVTQIYEAKQKRRAQAAVGVVEIVEQKAIAKEATTTIQAEAYAKVMDDTIVHGVLIDLTNTSVIEEIGEASNAAMANDVEPLILDP